MVDTIKQNILKTLEDLNATEMDKFRFCLLDRREERRISRSSLEGKSLYDVTHLLVSTFTERDAVKVTLEILRQMNCNDQADKLELKTKASLDTGEPTFRKTSDGKLETLPSQEAQLYVAPQQQAVKEPEEMEAEAKVQIRSEGGDLNNKKLILSRYKIQFGKYKGQTFKWLLDNDVGYTTYLVASHQEECKHTKCQDPMMANKDSFTRYTTAYPEIRREVRLHQEISLQPGQRGKALVGFGRYKEETLEKLYRSKDENKISYVNFLRNKTDYDPGSKMETAIKYILWRDGRGRARHQPYRAAQRKRKTSWRGKRDKLR